MTPAEHHAEAEALLSAAAGTEYRVSGWLHAAIAHALLAMSATDATAKGADLAADTAAVREELASVGAVDPAEPIVIRADLPELVAVRPSIDGGGAGLVFADDPDGTEQDMFILDLAMDTPQSLRAAALRRLAAADALEDLRDEVQSSRLARIGAPA